MGFSMVLLGFNRLHRVLIGFTWILIGFNGVLLGLALETRSDCLSNYSMQSKLRPGSASPVLLYVPVTDWQDTRPNFPR